MNLSEISFLLSIDEMKLTDDCRTYGSAVRIAYMKGLSLLALKVRQNVADLADAGSPNAINSMITALQIALNQIQL